MGQPVSDDAVHDATARAQALLAAERAGWPDGFDPAVIGSAWRAILDVFAAHVAQQPKEVQAVMTRTYLRSIGAIGAPGAEQLTL